MKKSIILFLILSISLSANAAEYTKENTRPCPQDKELVCSLENKPITGVLKDYDGWSRSEANYKAGKKEGLVKTYYENGDLRAEANYKNGNLEGFVRYYYENGNLSSEENYKNGKLDGLSKTYYENGNLDSEANCKEGEPEGLVKTYYQNGALREEFIFKEGEAISGFIYNEYGEKIELTNARLHNRAMLFKLNLQSELKIGLKSPTPCELKICF